MVGSTPAWRGESDQECGDLVPAVGLVVVVPARRDYGSRQRRLGSHSCARVECQALLYVLDLSGASSGNTI